MTNAAVQNKPSTNGASVGNSDADEALEGRVSISFSAPIAMRIELEKQAKDAGVQPADHARSVLAKAMGFTLPTTVKVRKSTMTDDEKKAEQKRKATEHREKMRELLNRHRAEAGLPVPTE